VQSPLYVTQSSSSSSVNLIEQTASPDPIQIAQPSQSIEQPIQQPPRRSTRERKLIDLGPGMVRYPEKGLIVLDPSTIAIEEDALGPGVVCSEKTSKLILSIASQKFISRQIAIYNEFFLTKLIFFTTFLACFLLLLHVKRRGF
jgi:hypothetical protein